jgi:DNA replication protein DnaC
MMCGTCGNGKTTLLYTLQSAINDLHRCGHFEFLGKEFRIGLRIVDAKDITEIAKDLDELKQYRLQQMLAIDDLGKEPTEVLNFGNVVSPVVDLLEYRYNHQLFTVVTTNLTPKEIREKYGARIADRFNEMLEVIRFQDISYRRLNR